MAVMLLGAVALLTVVVTEEGWIEVVAVAELAFLVAILALTKRWSDQHAETFQGLAEHATDLYVTHRDFGVRVVDVNAKAVRALSEHDPDAAADIAGEFLDAYAIYREHAPSRDEG